MTEVSSLPRMKSNSTVQPILQTSIRSTEVLQSSASFKDNSGHAPSIDEGQERERSRTPPFERMDIEEGESQGLNLISSLPRVDGGWEAWSYLAAATVLETLVWGFATSYGVFLKHYEELFPNSTSQLPLVGTIANGSMYLLLPPLTLFLASYPRWRPAAMWVGLVIMLAGLLGAAFATNGTALIITQGVLYGVGGTMLYCPVTSYMFEWWRYRRGLASGVMFSGTGAGGLVMPLISAALLERWGHRTTLISIAIGYGIILALLIPFIRPRLPLPAKDASKTPKINWTFLSRREFWLLWLGVLSQGLAAFMPGTYLPAYASALSLPDSVGTLSIALMNLARVPGQVLIGCASDKIGPRKMIMAMTILSTISVGAGWGAATNTGGLLGFALAFGSFAGSYTALFPRFINAIAEDDPHLPQILYALFSFARGLGSIASGPLSTALLNASGGLRGSIGGYGVEGYGALIIWTAAALAGSGVAAGYKGLKRD